MSDYYHNENLRKVLISVAKEGLLAAGIAGALGLIYSITFSERFLLRDIASAVFLMGIVLAVYALVFSMGEDKEIVKNVFKKSVKDLYMAKASIRQERLIHLFRAGVVFACATVIDLGIWYFY